MKPGGGMRKGASFEREIAKRLSLWVSGGTEIDLFWRTSMSGGRATVARKKGQRVRQSGDITAVTAEGHPFTDRFYIEAKAYRALQIDRFIVTGTGSLSKFWRTTKIEARKYHREPMLIFRQNGMPILVLLRKEYGSVAPKSVLLEREAVLYDFTTLLSEPFRP